MDFCRVGCCDGWWSASWDDWRGHGKILKVGLTSRALGLFTVFSQNSFRLVGIWSSLHRFILSFALVRAIGIPILMIARRSAVVDLCLSRNPTNQSGCESAATYATAVVAAMGIFSFLLMYYFYTCIESYRRRLAAAQYGVLGDPERALDPSGNPFKQGDRSSKDSGVYRSDTPPKSYSTSQPNDSSATLTAKPDWEAMPRPSFDPAARDSMETDPFHDIELPRASEEVERLEFPQPPPPFPIEAKYQRPPSN